MFTLVADDVMGYLLLQSFCIVNMSFVQTSYMTDYNVSKITCSMYCSEY